MPQVVETMRVINISHVQIRANRLMNLRKHLPANRRALDPSCYRYHRSKQNPHWKWLGFRLRENALVQNVEELRNADEQRDPMPMKGIYYTLR